MRLHDMLRKMLFLFLFIASFLSFDYYPVLAEDTEDLPTFSADDIQFELWIQKVFFNTSIYNGNPQTVYIIVKLADWIKGKPEWRFNAVKRLGCAARTMYFTDDLIPPYNVEILAAAPMPGGPTISVAEGIIIEGLCTHRDYLPILSPAKETPL